MMASRRSAARIARLGRDLSDGLPDRAGFCFLTGATFSPRPRSADFEEPFDIGLLPETEVKKYD